MGNYKTEEVTRLRRRLQSLLDEKEDIEEQIEVVTKKISDLEALIMDDFMNDNLPTHLYFHGCSASRSMGNNIISLNDRYGNTVKSWPLIRNSVPSLTDLMEVEAPAL